MARRFNEVPTITPGKINMEPENGPLEDYFPLQPGGSSVSMLASSRV